MVPPFSNQYPQLPASIKQHRRSPPKRILFKRPTDADYGANEPKIKLSSLEAGIKVTDVPQWRWTRDECATWLKAVLVHYLSWDPETALHKAKQLKGFGPMLYMANEAAWIKFLGEGPGACIYALLLSVRHSKGAVPKNIVLGHGEA